MNSTNPFPHPDDATRRIVTRVDDEHDHLLHLAVHHHRFGQDAPSEHILATFNLNEPIETAALLGMVVMRARDAGYELAQKNLCDALGVIHKQDLAQALAPPEPPPTHA